MCDGALFTLDAEDAQVSPDRRSSVEQAGSNPGRLEQRVQAGLRLAILSVHTAAEDQLVLERVLPPRELGHGDLVAARLEPERSDYIGQVTAKLAAVPRVSVQARPRAAPGSGCELPRDLGLTARDHGDVVRPRGDGALERVVRRGVAGVQRERHVDPLRQRRLGDRALDHLDALKARIGGDLADPLHEVRARLDAHDPPAGRLSELRAREQQAQVGFARAKVDEDGLGVPREDVGRRGRDQAEQVFDLLELSACVRVQGAVPGEQVERVQERPRKMRRHLVGEASRWGGQRGLRASFMRSTPKGGSIEHRRFSWGKVGTVRQCIVRLRLYALVSPQLAALGCSESSGPEPPRSVDARLATDSAPGVDLGGDARQADAARSVPDAAPERTDAAPERTDAMPQVEDAAITSPDARAQGDAGAVTDAHMESDLSAPNACDGDAAVRPEGEGQACETGQPGRCAPGYRTCLLGVLTCEPMPDAHPVDEVCNAVDDDCDGEVDEGVTEVCGVGIGECRTGEQRCFEGVFGACEGAVGPSDEVCNGLDDDCDGVLDDVAALGGAAFAAPAWRGLDAPLATAETADGRTQAVIFHAPDVNGQWSLTASTLDLATRSVFATWPVFVTRTALRPRAWFVNDALFIAFIDLPGNNAAQLQVHRYSVAGRALAPPVAFGNDVDDFSVATGPDAVGIVRSQARSEVWVSLIGRADGRVSDTHVTVGLPVVTDPEVTIVSRDGGFLAGSELYASPLSRSHVFNQWSIGSDGSVGPRVSTDLVDARQFKALETPLGPRLVYAFRYYGALPHLAIESRAIAADGTLLEASTLIAFPGDRDAPVPDLLFATAHGAAGIVVGEWLPDAAGERGLYLTRADNSGQPWAIRAPVLDGGAPLSFNLATGGGGPDIVHAWVRVATGEVVVARGSLAACPPVP